MFFHSILILDLQDDQLAGPTSAVQCVLDSTIEMQDSFSGNGRAHRIGALIFDLQETPITPLPSLVLSHGTPGWRRIHWAPFPASFDFEFVAAAEESLWRGKWHACSMLASSIRRALSLTKEQTKVLPTSS